MKWTLEKYQLAQTTSQAQCTILQVKQYQGAHTLYILFNQKHNLIKFGYKKKFHKRKPRERQMMGLSVPVYHNNIELALKKLKRKVKNSDLFLELKKRAYYEKPSKIKREKINLAKLRNKWAVEKEKENN